MENIKFLDLTGLTSYDSKIKAYINGRVSSAGTLKRSIVSALPAVAEADENMIYMIKRANNGLSTNANDQYDEYLLIEGNFELIGNTEVNLEGYATEEYADGKASEAQTAAEAHADSVAGTAEANAKAYADTKKSEVIGTSADASTADTINGAKKFAEEKSSAAESNAKTYAEGQASTAETNAKAYADTKKSEVLGTAADEASANTVYGAKAAVVALGTTLKGSSSDAATAETIAGAKKHAEEKASAAESAAITSANSYTDTELAKIGSIEETSIANLFNTQA